MTAETRARADAGTRAGTSAPGVPAGSVAELVEVCARQADALAAQAEAAQRAVATQLRAIEQGRAADAIGAGCWLGSTLRVLAGSLGELHTVLDEAAQRARHDHPTPLPVPRPRPAEQGRGRDEVVGGAVEVLHGLRDRLGPEVSQSLAGIWICASAALYGEPAEERADHGVSAGHDTADSEEGEGR